MSVIQNIRGKYLGVMIGTIVVALVGFLFMDSVQNNSMSIFGDNDNSLATVEGNAITNAEYNDIEKRYMENAQKENPELSDREQEEVRMNAYQDMVNQKLLEKEYQRLGIAISDKELAEMETDPQFADPIIQQNFRNEQGMFDPSRVTSFVTQLRSGKVDTTQRKAWMGLEKQLIESRLAQKYSTLIGLGMYVPKAFLDSKIGERNQVASIDYVKIPYDKITDDKVKVTDEDCKAYMTKYANLFQLPEPMRKCEYVAFDIIPTAADSALSLGVVRNGMADMATASDIQEFLGKNNSEEGFDNNYYSKGKSPNAAIDSAINAGVGTVLGPIYDKGAFKAVKVISKRDLPDSVKASHILVAFSKEVSEEDAEKKIDSLKKIVTAANFAQIAATASEDPGSKEKGGDLGYFGKGMMLKEFNDTCFLSAKGSIKKVKTNAGFHIIYITDQKDFKPCAQVACLTKSLTASSTTRNAVSNIANKFLSTASNKAAFDEGVKKAGLNKKVAENLVATQNVINGLGSGRDLVRWAFDDKTKIGNVSPIKTIKDGYTEKYVVACLSEVAEKGMAPVSIVRTQLEGVIRKEKKAKMIADQFKAGTLNEVATKAGSIVSSADTVLFAAGMNPVFGNEAKVVGAAFNEANKGKVSTGIAGNDGVYFISTKNIINSNATITDMDRAREKQMMVGALQQTMSKSLTGVLRKRANIVDNRSKFQ